MLDLFRREALSHRTTNWFGQIVLIRPLSFAFYVAAALTVTAMLGLFLVYGRYTKKARIVGILIPDSGLIRVLAPSSGTVVDTRVAEGYEVNSGSVVITLSTDRASSANRSTHMTIGRSLSERKSSLTEEIANAEMLSRQQEDAFAQRASSIRIELIQVQREIETQRQRVLSAQEQVQRYRELHTAKFISDLQLQQKQDDLLDQQGKLQGIERGRMILQRELAQVKSDLKEIPLKRARERASANRSIGAVEQEEADNEAKRTAVIVAPENGVVTAVLHRRGAYIKSGDTLFTLLPSNLKLEAHLFAPSKSIGFVEKGQVVLLRYQAYPFQKYGQYRGIVTAISRAALEPTELPSTIPGATNSGESMYRVTVALESQAAIANGRAQRLQAGMLVEADVIIDTRTLLEWIFEPLYSLKGRL